MRELNFTATDGTVVNVSVWDVTENQPIGCVYIAHGMAEYSARYARFAEALNKEGFAVWAADERGHGKTAKVRGVVEEDCFCKTVEDTKTAIERMRATYGQKIFLLGHSYGSAIAQRFLELYSDSVVGACLSGTTYFASAATKLGKIVAKLGKAIFGAEKPAKLIAKLSFGMYNKPYRKEGKNAWLSRDRAEVDKYNADPDCGFVLSYGFYDSFFKGSAEIYGKDFKKIRRDLPLIIAAGEKDPVSSKSKLAKKMFLKYRKLGLPVVYKRYEGARHEILNEIDRDAVTEDIVRFVKFCNEDKKDLE